MIPSTLFWTIICLLCIIFLDAFQLPQPEGRLRIVIQCKTRPKPFHRKLRVPTTPFARSRRKVRCVHPNTPTSIRANFLQGLLDGEKKKRRRDEKEGASKLRQIGESIRSRFRSLLTRPDETPKISPVTLSDADDVKENRNRKLVLKDLYFATPTGFPNSEKALLSNYNTSLIEIADTMPKGLRWATSSPDTNLTGKWTLIVTEPFKKEYNSYLRSLGQPTLVRSVAVKIAALNKEEIIQEDGGRRLTIKGTNPRGVWNRVLLSSGSDLEDEDEEDFERIFVPILTADKEKTEVEAWWENEGTVHKSCMRGGKKYGDFNSTRYLESEDILVCHSVCEGKKIAEIKWRFRREA